MTTRPMHVPVAGISVTAETAGARMTTRPLHLYLSGPITGWPDYNRSAFTSAARVLRDAGYTVTNPLENGLPDQAEWAEHMRADIASLVTHATALAMLPEWRTSRGASLEHHIAVGLGMPCLPVYMWLDLKHAMQPDGQEVAA